MPADTPSADKKKFFQIIEKLLDAEHELDFLLTLERGDLERLVVAIRGRLAGSR
ncbi:MAG: hypothetical protein ABSD38_30120 [Syntrophorhabdales bacterium]|jgi:hypothetical protein